MVHPTPLRQRASFRVRLGFVPLLDSAPLIMARELGLFDAEGLEVELSREGSWASMRDKIAFGLLDGGQMLAPMPLNMSLAADGPHTPIISAMVLSRNGNGITLSRDLYQQLVSPGINPDDPMATACRLIRIARERGEPVQLASVAPWSSHDLQLRDWLATAGPEAMEHVRILPVSPIQMEDAFRSGTIEGCCVGEPWNSLLEYQELGRIIHAGHQIWQDAPEKVLGMRGDWADQHTTVHRRLIRALIAACRWLDDPDNHGLLRDILSQPDYLGEQVMYLDNHPFSLFHPDLHQNFFRNSANFPWISQAHWLATRMLHWHQLAVHVSDGDLRKIIRPDLFREAAASMGIDTPLIDSKTEGHHARPFTLNGRFGPVNVSSDALIGSRLHDWLAACRT